MTEEYNVPPKVGEWAKRNALDVNLRLMQQPAGITEGCPLKGFVQIKKDPNWHPDVADALGELIDGVESRHPLGAETIDGCAALRDPICYLDRGTDQQPQVPDRWACPVYQAVVATMGPPILKDYYDTKPKNCGDKRWRTPK